MPNSELALCQWHTPRAWDRTPDLTVPSPRARREHTHNNTLTMGLGRKANKGDTSATSTSGDESSWMPSQVAADLSDTALEVRSRPGQVASRQAW